MFINLENKISNKAIKYWRIKDSIFYVSYFLILTLIKLTLNYHWVNITIYCLLVVGIILYPIEIFIVPSYKIKTWRYGIDKKELCLKYGGIIKKTYLRIPLSKIYYVKKNQNVISKKLMLYSIHIGTIAHVHKIPALNEKAADKLCNTIIEFQSLYTTEEVKNDKK